VEQRFSRDLQLITTLISETKKPVVILAQDAIESKGDYGFHAAISL
jgi:hypothetical protein